MNAISSTLKTAMAASRTVTEAVTLDLRKRILQGDFDDGHQLRQDAIAAEYGVSRIPVREALRQLEAEELIVFHPHRGAQVLGMSAADIRESHQIRAMLESEALSDEAPDAALLVELAAAADVFEAAAAEGDAGGAADADLRFHQRLGEASPRQLTWHLAERLHRRTLRYAVRQAETDGFEAAVAEHRAMVAAARAGDAEALKAALSDHIIREGERLAAMIAEPDDL